MKVSLDISLHPLTEDYEEVVIGFIQQLKKYPDLEIETNGLSTQIFGDYDRVMAILNSQMRNLFEEHKAVFVLKIAKGELKKENLPEVLK